MNTSRYDERCAEEAETRLARIEAAKERMRKSFVAEYNALCIDIDGVYTMAQTWALIEEAIDDLTHLDRATAEKTISDYESASQRQHKQQESTYYSPRRFA